MSVSTTLRTNKFDCSRLISDASEKMEMEIDLREIFTVQT